MRTCIALAAMAFAGSAAAMPINVALNKPVALTGVFGNSTAGTPIGWADPAPGPASLVTDGTFSPSQTNWQVNSVWWHEYDTLPPRQIVIDLLGTHTLSGAIVQADNNETYVLEYLDTADAWQALWLVPAVDTNGVETRPDPGNNATMFGFAPVDAKALRISAGQGGDRYFSVTEVQAFTEVPAPATLPLLGLGLAGLACLRRRASKQH